jgi:predicted SAM-dependent methyltransferase
MTRPTTTYPNLRRHVPPCRLHIGAGRAHLDGWVNMDIQALPGVDVVADATKGINFTNVEAVYAEHFLEHLAINDAIGFLLECHKALNDGCWLRLSTPNLDWVWATHYHLSMDPDTKREAAIHLNRAFHGWRHRFVWNREMLGETLAACGYDPVRWCRYGESELSIFQGIERHETYDDEPGLPHVLIAEACKSKPQPDRLRRLQELVWTEFLRHMDD